MTTEQKKTKATRRLSNLDFSGVNSAVALVGKEQGNAANGRTTLLLKAAQFTDSHLEKASKIKVTLDIQEFLTQFYGIYGAQAEVLAQALGYSTDKSDDEYPDSYEDYIASQVSAIEVIKQLGQSEDINKSLSELEPEQYLDLLKSQALLEKAFKKVEKDSKVAVKAAPSEEGTPTAVATAKEAGKAKAEDVSSSKTKPTEKSNMTVKTTEQEVLVEMVEKSQFESIEKALKEQGVALEKALETVKQFEKEKQEAIQKSRKDLLTATIKETEKVEALFKAFANVESDEVFKGAITALEGLMQVQKSSDLFKEVGASAQAESKDEEGALMKLAKAAAAKASK